MYRNVDPALTANWQIDVFNGLKGPALRIMDENQAASDYSDNSYLEDYLNKRTARLLEVARNLSIGEVIDRIHSAF